MGLPDTLSLERSILKLLCTQPMTARAFWGRLPRERMSSVERLFLYDLGLEKHKSAKSVLTDQLVLREIDIRIDQADRPNYRAEWSLVKGLTVTESPEALLQELERSHLALETVRITGAVDDLIRRGNVDEAIATAKQKFMRLRSGRAKRETVDFAQGFERRLDLVLKKKANPAAFLGLRTGLKVWDQLIGGLFKAELTLLAGITGKGKSTLLKGITDGILRHNPGKNVLYITNEESQEQVENKFDAVFTNIPYVLFKRPNAVVIDGKVHTYMDDAAVASWRKVIEGMQRPTCGRLLVAEVSAGCTVVDLEEAYYEQVNAGVNIDLIVFDYLGRMKPVQRFFSEVDEDEKKTVELHDLSRALNLPILSAAQAATVVEAKTDKGHRAGDLDVYGGKGQIHNTNNFAILTRVGQDSTQTGRPDYDKDWFLMVDVKKQRDGPGFHFYVRHQVRTGRVSDADEAEVHANAKSAAAAAKAQAERDAKAEDFVLAEEEAAALGMVSAHKKVIRRAMAKT